MNTKKHDKTLLIISGLILIVLFCNSQAATIYVNDDASGANDGSSWTDAYNYLQDAMHDPALTYGDEIWVAQGTYYPDANSINPSGTGNREATFQLVNGAGLYGGFPDSGKPIWEDRDPNLYETILSGDLDSNDTLGLDPCDLRKDPNRVDNSYHVVTGSEIDPNTILDGFTIVAGYAWSGFYPHNGGGGMGNFANSNPQIVHCTFMDNLGYVAGGMHNEYSNPNITNCTFINNSAVYWGGGMVNFESQPTLNNCTFNDNFADVGGGMHAARSNIVLNKCIFSNNLADGGGGMRCWDDCSLTFNDCTFSGNSADDDGGGMIIGEPSISILNNCTFSGNSSNSKGGGILCAGIKDGDTLTLNNCTFSGNSSSTGSGIYCMGFISHGKFTLNNCTFSDNHASSMGGGIYLYGFTSSIRGWITLNNCILWNNIALENGNEVALESNATINVNYSDIQGGEADIHISDSSSIINWGIGNIDVDPLFVDPGYWHDNSTPADANDDYWVNGDYHLKSEGWRWDTAANDWTYDDVTSRCIDAGNPGSPLEDEPLTLDVDPQNRFGENIHINMGAYGGTTEASMPPYDWTLLSDVNNDGTSNLPDFAEMGLEWLTSGDNLPCDFSRDGEVGLDDVMLMTQDWLNQTSWH